MKGTGAGFGEQGRRLDYGTYLRIPDLLLLQQSLTSAHDELLFIVVHQAYELWFRLILHELEAARDAMARWDAYWPLPYLHRVAVVERLLMTQVDVLDTNGAPGVPPVPFRARARQRLPIGAVSRDRVPVRAEGRELPRPDRHQRGGGGPAPAATA